MTGKHFEKNNSTIALNIIYAIEKTYVQLIFQKLIPIAKNN